MVWRYYFKLPVFCFGTMYNILNFLNYTHTCTDLGVAPTLTNFNF